MIEKYNNLIYENHGTYYIEKEYNRKGLATKLDMYSDVL